MSNLDINSLLGDNNLEEKGIQIEIIKERDLKKENKKK